MREEREMFDCPFCKTDTAGNHQPECPNYPYKLVASNAYIIGIDMSKGPDYVTISGDESRRLRDIEKELGRYKEQVKRIPDICYRESCLNCGLTICPKHKPLSKAVE